MSEKKDEKVAGSEAIVCCWLVLSEDSGITPLGPRFAGDQRSRRRLEYIGARCHTRTRTYDPIIAKSNCVCVFNFRRPRKLPQGGTRRHPEYAVATRDDGALRL